MPGPLGARKGLSLGTTLMVVAVLVVVGLTVVAVSLQTLHVSVRLGSLAKARQAAESVVSVGIENLLANPQYGLSRSPGDQIAISPRAGDAWGHLAFEGAVYSTNNLAGEGPVPGYAGRAVPPHCAHLIGVGTSGGVRRQIETVVRVPPFPYAIACSGPFESSGGLYLAGVASPQDVRAESTALPTAKLRPAHLLSNGIGPQAVRLGPNTTIAGDLRSAGGIQMDPSSTQILGEMVRNGSPRSIPRLDVASLDPLLTGRSDVAFLGKSTAAAPAYQGFVRRQGDFSITGGLILDNGVLFVQGNLKIDGGIRGVGAVLATGSVQVEGATTLSSDDRLALVSGEGMALRGQARDASFYQGLIYSGGSFTADRITLVGSLIVQAAQAPTLLSQVQLIRSSKLARLEITTTPTVNLNFAPGSSLGDLRIGRRQTGFSVQDPDDETSEGDLDEFDAADKVSLLLNRRGVQGAPNRQEILAKLESMPTTQPTAPDFSLDPSAFLPVEERFRVVLWEER